MEPFHRLALACATAALVCLPAVGAPPSPSEAARAQLAPGGKLRVALIMGNPNFTGPGATAENPHGIAVDLGKELAKLAGATFEPVPYLPIAQLVSDASAGKWDVAFLGLEESRRKLMDYSDPYLFSENTYLVPAGSPFMTAADVDRDGTRVAVSARSAQEAFLTAELKKAKLVPVTTNVEGLIAMQLGKAEALGAGRSYLEAMAARETGYRVVSGNYRASPIAAAVPKGRAEAHAYLKQFMQYAKESGLLKRSVDQAKLIGVSMPK